MNKLKVGTTLTLGFAAVLLMLAFATLLSISRMADMNENMDIIVREQYPKVLEAQSILDLNNKIARSLRNSLLISDTALAAKEIATVQAKRKEIEEAYGRLTPLIKSDKGKGLLAAMQSARKTYDTALDEVIRLQEAGQRDEAVKSMLENMRASQLAYMDAIGALIKHQSSVIELGRQNAEDAYTSGRLTMIIMGALALVAGIAAAWIITRSLLKQLGGEPEYASGIARQIAAGDLAVRIDIKDGDKSSLLYAIRGMRDSLAQIVGEVRLGTDSIATASAQIAAGNLDLSARTEQQAGSLEETASSMEELTSTVKQNTDSARQANELAQSASSVAVRGGAVVSQVVDTMSAINESSRKISDIIGVIDGIAFQTNILALNAAVEAARAGEQGRGFAVVASEVRNLAQRSAGAAKEIKELIGDSVEKVNAGAQLVDQAGATMGEIVDSVQRVTNIMGEITNASHEQEAGIEQINGAVAEMDSVTQQNAALVEEAAAAATSLQEQASRLAELVGVFRLDASATAARAPAAAKTAAPRSAASVVLKPAEPLLRPQLSRKPASQPKAAAKASADEWEEF
ncbi:methyl-accepting chemotaxis protein [Massilia sp. BJB1822]|uniref:methyl-accepting chemotaxis protein n=1 Tax=Massilia sp. BJB1822 TaxID=2744470 RepID=UPI001592B2EB|nr:methyl-accepting chemotaxis protein [Massilia sp. BJB1822]NVD98406.1 MCP four helix bundle domain-containing protein [Massilia sp. BJB1822]